MDATQFSPDQRAYLVPIEGGVVAFVPPPLPREVPIDTDTLLLLGDADRAIGRLNGVGGALQNPYLLIQPFLRREAVLSSRIEGTQASLSDLAIFEAAPATSAAQLPADVQEVANYVQALEVGLARDRSAPMDLDLVRELHRVLMRGVRGNEASPGEFRRVQNYIARPGSPITQATYVPPPVDRLDGCLVDLERFLQNGNRLPPLVRLAMLHYQFEAIHPFRDGNGRVGRLLVALMLVDLDLISQPLLYLSAFFERERAEYYEGLASVSREGSWIEWIRFFLRGVAEQAADAVDRATRLGALRDEFRHRLQAPRGSALPLELVDRLFVRPVLTVPEAQRILKVTHRAAGMNVKKLVDAGILSEMATPRAIRGRLYFSQAIMDLLQRDLPTEPEQQRLAL
jgi:Fic family protein